MPGAARPSISPLTISRALPFLKSHCLMVIMRILGIDPGLQRVGFGVIESDLQQRYHARDWGVITTSGKEAEVQRLAGIHEAITELIKQTKPDVAVVEQIFFFRNVTTMVPVCQARGVLLLALHTAGVPYYEFTPMQVKLNLTGYGKASKKEVQEMVKLMLEMDELPQPDDAADGLALAMSYAFGQGPVSMLSKR